MKDIFVWYRPKRLTRSYVYIFGATYEMHFDYEGRVMLSKPETAQVTKVVMSVKLSLWISWEKKTILNNLLSGIVKKRRNQLALWGLYIQHIDYEGRVMLSKPETALQVTEVVMSVKLSQEGNFFILATKANTTLLSTIKNCFRIFDAPWNLTHIITLNQMDNFKGHFNLGDIF